MDNGIGGILYIRTPSGISKLLQIIFSLCAFISAVASDLPWKAAFHAYFCVIALLALIYALLILVVSILNFMSDLQTGSKIDIIFSIVLSILIFSAAALYSNINNSSSAVMSACIFQYLSGFSFIGYTLYKIWIA